MKKFNIVNVCVVVDVVSAALILMFTGLVAWHFVMLAIGHGNELYILPNLIAAVSAVIVHIVNNMVLEAHFLRNYNK